MLTEYYHGNWLLRTVSCQIQLPVLVDCDGKEGNAQRICVVPQDVFVITITDFV